MGTIIVKNLKNGDTKYIVQHRVTGAPYESKQFDSEFDAVEYEAKRDAELRYQISGRKNLGVKQFMQFRFVDVIDEYLKQDIQKHRNGLVMLRPFFGELLVQELTRSKVKEIIKKISKTNTYQKTPYKAVSIAKMFTCATAAHRWKLEQMDLPDMATPFKQSYISEIVGPVDIPRDRRLEGDEEMLLRARLLTVKKHKEWDLIIDLALETAARQAELVHATWSEFQLDRGVWNIPKEHTKTKKARTMPLSHKAKALLEEHYKVCGKPTKDQRVFQYLNNTDMVSSMFRKLIRQAGIVDFHFHDLRHEAISRIVIYRRNISIYEVMRMVGHSSIEMLNRYANLRGDELAVKFNQC